MFVVSTQPRENGLTAKTPVLSTGYRFLNTLKSERWECRALPLSQGCSFQVFGSAHLSQGFAGLWGHSSKVELMTVSLTSINLV